MASHNRTFNLMKYLYHISQKAGKLATQVRERWKIILGSCLRCTVTFDLVDPRSIAVIIHVLNLANNLFGSCVALRLKVKVPVILTYTRCSLQSAHFINVNVPKSKDHSSVSVFKYHVSVVT